MTPAAMYYFLIICIIVFIIFLVLNTSVAVLRIDFGLKTAAVSGSVAFLLCLAFVSDWADLGFVVTDKT